MGKKPHDIEKTSPSEFEELEQQIYEAFLARGWIIPQTEGDVSAAEALMIEEDHEELPSELHDADAVLNRSPKRSGRVAVPQPDDHVTSDLARAARAGKNIPQEVEERMRRDRAMAEQNLDDQ